MAFIELNIYLLPATPQKVASHAFSARVTVTNCAVNDPRNILLLTVLKDFMPFNSGGKKVPDSGEVSQQFLLSS